MNFADTFTLLHSPIATVRVEPPDLVIVEGPAIKTLRFARSRLQRCEVMVENGELAIRLHIEGGIEHLGPFARDAGSALAGAINRTRRNILFATPDSWIAMAEDDANLLISDESSYGFRSVPATSLVAITPYKDGVALEFSSGPSQLVGPLSPKHAATLALAFRGWRSLHAIDREPTEVTERQLLAEPHRWHLRRIRVTGTWYCAFETNHFANAWLVSPDGGRPGAGTYSVRVVGTWVYPNVKNPQYGGMGASPGELRAESVEVLAVGDQGPGTNRDGLTGLYSRAALEVSFAKLRSAAESTAGSISFALFNLDHFKRYNDAHGHAAGDILLRTYAVAIQAAARTIDVVARWRGEEFAIVMRSADLDIARDVAGRVLDAVRRLQLVTCSAGVAQARRGETLGEIARRAELAMIEAKRAGRDRLLVAP